MATIERRPNGRWQAQVCVNGKRRAKTFIQKAEAKRWALQQEIAFQAGETLVEAITLGELMDRYVRERAVQKHNIKYDTVKAKWFAKTSIGTLLLADLTPDVLKQFQDERLAAISTASVKREFTLLRSALNYAVERNWLPSNPLRQVKPARDNPHRERIATPEEIDMICVAAGWDRKTPPTTQTARVAAAFVLSCLTGMRGGEILQIRSEWIDGRVIHLPASATKTRIGRDVALQAKAMEIIEAVRSLGLGEPIWQVSDENRDAIFRKLRDRCGLRDVVDSAGTVVKQGLHFHDARATFCTWAASPGKNGAPRLDVLALARQLGHGDLKMLQKYYRPSAKELADRLDE